ncbi:S-adenosyl-L-methionine-dependent methyltransferase [Venustampulla echinocandica]|uniref:S-adenosyl-L-methionine-dependent methyltransferase n=1 Tax=Venustampulla echinocandica TaxID=2656787 RepID=A0A370U021_9HELO|nr:S-adenosyl-L-methionine-dependent methyltransferase [Venustampulla echinocandica]RDL41121.1 S-adenosyl-L-methionine-dependent methyltransferase [Venustampulla echinocandica]
MASHGSDFDPHTRVKESTKDRRLGTPMQSARQKLERGEMDCANRPGRMVPRRGQSTASKTQQKPGLPKPALREPLPISTSIPEPKSSGLSKYSYGFGKQTKSPATGAPGPELKKKSSRNVLRRKPSLIAQQSAASRPTVDRSASLTPAKPFQILVERRPSTEHAPKSADAYNEIFTRPSRTRTPAAKEAPRIIPELDRYRTNPEQDARARSKTSAEIPHKLATHDLPPPTPLLSSTPVYSGATSNYNRYSGYSGSGYSASPSTRFSESPGPGGAYSRDTTPTSMSSQSPGIIAPSKLNPPRLRQGSPATNRPLFVRTRTGSFANEVEEIALDQQGLPYLRESPISSSSNSTVKVDAKGNEKKAKKQRLVPLPPTPPPRKSSQKLKQTSSEEQGSPSKLSQAPAKPVMAPTSRSSPLKLRNAPGKSPASNTPPVRPSRDGTPDLQSQLGESITVIQSNLASFAFPQNHRQSGIQRNATTSPTQPQSIRRPSHATGLPARNPSPSPVQPSSRELTPGPSDLGIVPDLRPREGSIVSRSIATRTPSPSISTSKSRFGLFGRRTKTAPEVPTLKPQEKGSRKGPVAGTGHEGYGRYGLRGRSTSAGSLGVSRDRSQSRASSSRDSVGSAHAEDPFLQQRMSPVIIAGGGEIIENRNTSSELSRTESNTSVLLGRPSIESRTSSKSSLGHEASRNTLWPSALPKEPPKRTSKLAIPKGRRPSDSSDDVISNTSSLAFRRSVLRLNNSTSTLNFPRPLNLPTRGTSPAMSSIDASIMSDDSQLDMKAQVGRGRKAPATKPKKLEKRAKSPRKWNFFHRSQPSTKPKAETSVQVSVKPATAKAIPHYAMLDSSDEQQEPDIVALEDILRDAAGVELSSEELEALQFSNYKENLRRIENLHSMMDTPLPEPPAAPVICASPETIQVIPEPSKPEFHLNKEPSPVRPSRLPQVGRIPKVISARPQATSPKSFSRPFARLSLVQSPLQPAAVDKDSVAVGPSPPKSSTPVPPCEAPLLNPVVQGENSRQGSGDSKASGSGTSHHDFLTFSPRKNSEATSNSSGGMSFAGTTAVVPEAGSALEEDEVWDEYDDLIEDDDMKVPVSATSSHGVPFQYESYESRRARKSRMKAKESPTLNSTPVIKEPARVEEPSRRSEFTTSSVYSADMSTRLREAVDTAPTPTTPMSFGDFISGYGDRNNSVYSDLAEKSSRCSQASSTKSASASSHTHSISEPGTLSPISQVNLRVGSMTVSKWLTFGHVLFSPAREEITQLEGSSKPRSILVIDGLGNDDWSFYAAETYPTSTFYNLSPTRPLSASQRNSNSNSFPLTPRNHRQVQYTSSLHKFPFPSSTFHVVVLRFPAAMSEASYRNIIAESKRVLKPAGYLEMAILDLDLMNMGNRSRRAIRGLKVKTQVADPSISLGSASDTVLKLVGKRGFCDIKTCNVGVPVASTIPSRGQRKEKKEEMSLADMMRDESQVGDDGITKMVAKVGRWWYTRCYEMAVLPEGDISASIFNDAHLLSECEKWNSSFKLVVAYAQKPVVGRRRTASV